MKTKVIYIDEKNIESPGETDKLREAAEAIKVGGLVVFPTETVYGLGANALDAHAVQKIYEAKGRPFDNPLIVHVAEPGDIYRYAELPGLAGEIMARFLPGPLTLVLKKKGHELDACCKLDTVAIRVPANNTARKLIALSGVPVAAPSANLSGKPSHTDPGYIVKDLEGRADVVVCGENCEIGLESTVVSFDPDGSLNILRTGAITREMLSGYSIREAAPKCEPPRSPGMKYTHYSPEAPLYILSGSEEKIVDFVKGELRQKRAGFLCFDELLGYFEKGDNIVPFGPRGDLAAQAKNLFGALNRFDALGVEAIYAPKPENTGIGEAVCDRLMKASGGKVIKL